MPQRQPPGTIATNRRARHDYRPRKLLLHRKEVEQLARRVHERGLTLVPLRLYFKSQLVKVELGVARGRKAYDKRQALAKRDAAREMDRVRKARSRGA